MWMDQRRKIHGDQLFLFELEEKVGHQWQLNVNEICRGAKKQARTIHSSTLVPFDGGKSAQLELHFFREWQPVQLSTDERSDIRPAW